MSDEINAQWKVEIGVGITWLGNNKWMYDEQDRYGKSTVHDLEYLAKLTEAHDYLVAQIAADESVRHKMFSLTLDRQEPILWCGRVPGEVALRILKSAIDRETPQFKTKAKQVHVCHRTIVRRQRTGILKAVSDMIDRIINEESK